jgi:hypothetical protein
VIVAFLFAATLVHAEGQRGGRNATPIRSCESLATVALPNTTIEAAAVDQNNPHLCRVTAVTTHPPAGDKVRIWVGIPMTNWNGRFLGVGGGGFSGGNPRGQMALYKARNDRVSARLARW